MSWLKFWGKKSSKNDKKSRSELVRSESFNNDQNFPDAERDKNGRLRHTMSISRSGRFKQKNKQRSGILDKPEFYDGADTNEGQKENVSNGVPPSFVAHEQKRTPPSTCREVSQHPHMTSRPFEGHTTVL